MTVRIQTFVTRPVNSPPFVVRCLVQRTVALEQVIVNETVNYPDRATRWPFAVCARLHPKATQTWQFFRSCLAVASRFSAHTARLCPWLGRPSIAGAQLR